MLIVPPATRITKIWGGAELRTWPEGDFVGNTRGSERVKEAKNDVIRGLNARRCFSRIGIE